MRTKREEPVPRSRITETEETSYIRRLSARTIVITFLVTYREMRYDNPEEQIRYKELRGFLPDVCNSLVYETKPDQVVTPLNSRCLLFR